MVVRLFKTNQSILSRHTLLRYTLIPGDVPGTMPYHKNKLNSFAKSIFLQICNNAGPLIGSILRLPTCSIYLIYVKIDFFLSFLASFGKQQWDKNMIMTICYNMFMFGYFNQFRKSRDSNT